MGLVHAKIEIGIETSPQLIESLHTAREMALQANAAEVLPMHLALAMLEDDESSFLLEAYGVNFDKVRIQLSKQARAQAQPKTNDRHAVFSPAIEALMQHAREQAQKNALGEVDGNLILAIVLSQESGTLAKLLKPYDLDTSGVLQYLELREGKTVDIDPLPALQAKTPPSVNRARGENLKNTPASAPASLHPAKSVPPAPLAMSLSPQNTGPTAASIPQNQPDFAPHQPHESSIQHPLVNNSNDPFQGAVAKAPHMPPPSSMKPNQEATALPSSPVPAAIPIPAPMPPHVAARPTPINGGPLPMPVGQNSIPVPIPPSPKVPAPSNLEAGSANASTPDPAPSRFRSMISGLGKALKSKSAPPLNDMLETATPVPTPSAADRVQTLPAAKPVHLKGPTTQSVDQLVNQPVPGPVQGAGNGPTFAQMAQQNRPAKRRRAIPSSLGANESLSATGSVLEKGRLVENVPRRMKVNQSSKAEVRITRAQMEEINNEFDNLSDSHIHELAVTEAMTVQLRAPGHGFHIENLSPQTQWIDRNQRHVHDADFGVWRWNVTPTKSGKARLQLVISARTVDDEGTIHIADIPDKIIELGVYRDHAQILRRAGILTIVALAGLALGRYGETAYQWLAALATQIG